MSTKIYNGYIFNKKIKTLDQAHKYLRSVRSQFENSGKYQIKEVAVRVAQYFFDSLENNVLNSEHKKAIEEFKSNQYQDNLLSQIIHKTENMFREDAKSPYRSGIYDLNCSVMLYQYQNRILVLFYGSQKFRKIFESLKLIEDFHYQDQTDEPKDIPKKEFKLRGRWWEKVMDDKTPAQSGLSFSLMTDYESYFILPTYSDIVESLGSDIEQRTKTIVRALSQKEMPFPKVPKDALYSEMNQILETHINSPEFIALENKLRKTVKIKKSFSIEDFKKTKILAKLDKVSK